MTSLDERYVMNDLTTTGDNDEEELIQTILSVSYGLSLKTFKRLGGYDDVNYYVAVDQDQSHHVFHANPPRTNNSYVLRIFNAKDSAEPSRMDKLDIRVVCLRSFLGGEPLENIPWTADMFFKLGVFVAEVTQALEDFHDPFFDTFSFSWSVENIFHLKEISHFVKDSQVREVVEDILNHPLTEMFESASHTKKVVVHGDIRLGNIIVQNVGDFSGAFSRWGLIDFHDAHKTFPLRELANSGAYCLCQVPIMAENIQSLDAICQLVDGYRSVIPLDVREVELLVGLMKVHLCMTVVHGFRQCYLEPDNVDYIRVTLDPACRLLKDIHGKSTGCVVQTLLTVRS